MRKIIKLYGEILFSRTYKDAVFRTVRNKKMVEKSTDSSPLSNNNTPGGLQSEERKNLLSGVYLFKRPWFFFGHHTGRTRESSLSFFSLFYLVFCLFFIDKGDTDTRNGHTAHIPMSPFVVVGRNCRITKISTAGIMCAVLSILAIFHLPQ